jgi:hypothetical protein
MGGQTVTYATLDQFFASDAPDLKEIHFIAMVQYTEGGCEWIIIILLFYYRNI